MVEVRTLEGSLGRLNGDHLIGLLSAATIVRAAIVHGWVAPRVAMYAAMTRGGHEGRTFAEVLRDMRRQQGLPQEDLAERAGLDPTYISQIERGLKSPTLRSLQQIAAALGVKLSMLIALMEE